MTVFLLLRFAMKYLVYPSHQLFSTHSFSNAWSGAGVQECSPDVLPTAFHLHLDIPQQDKMYTQYAPHTL